MKIVYFAKHDSGGNDDEGAISYALEYLGHSVIKFQEYQEMAMQQCSGDLLLCHLLHDLKCLERVAVPKVFWCFDCIISADPFLRERSEIRSGWIRELTRVCDLGFCADGDWVSQDDTGKLYWLTQGADERVVGKGIAGSQKRIPLLFTGIKQGGGRQRVSWIEEIEREYGPYFLHVEKGRYGRDLADLIARTDLVLAPDSPATDRYWGNRVYNVLGFGGSLLHPYCAGLAEQYFNGDDLLFYSGREEMHNIIRRVLDRPEQSKEMTSHGLRKTIQSHLYRHRCEEMMQVVKEKLRVN